MPRISILLIYIKLLQRHGLVRVAARGGVTCRVNRDKVEWACSSECTAINFTPVHCVALWRVLYRRGARAHGCRFTAQRTLNFTRSTVSA